MTHSHQTLDLLDNVTDVKQDGLETTVIPATMDGLDQSATPVSLGSAPRVDAPNASRMAIGLEIIILSL